MVDGLELLRRYDLESESIVSDNANFNKSFSGLQAYISGETLKEYALKQLVPEDAKKHLDGALHIHNLSEGFFVNYCHGGSLLSLLMKGIKCGDITSKPAKHYDAVIDHISNYLMMITSEFSGAVSFSDFNTLLAPFIRNDGLTYKQVKQGIQRLFFNLNFPQRSNFQSPFSNLTFNLRCPKQLTSTPTIIGGIPQSSTYADFEEEADIILEATTEILLEGDGCGRPLTFPIPTLNLVKGYEKSEVFSKVVENVVKLGSWYFTNYTNGFITEDSVRSLCCRLSLNLEELSQARGLWNVGDGTGSLGIVTINAGRIGYLCKKGGDFFEETEKVLKSARHILQVKRKIVESGLRNGYLPLSKFYGLNLDHYFNTVGIIGLNEMYLNYDGYGLYAHIGDVAKYLDYINVRLKEFQREDGVLYNLEMTPGESTCGRFAKMDLVKYPDIVTQGGGDTPYYSTLLIPPKDEIFWTYKLEAEAQLLPKFSGGTVHRIYLGKEDEPNHLFKMVDMVSAKTIPYFDFSPAIAYCPSCGFREVGVNVKCSKCGSPTEIWSRVVGYVRPIQKWSKTKQAEFWDRKHLTFG